MCVNKNALPDFNFFENKTKMNKYFFVIALFAFSPIQKTRAQYYHKDIISIRQANDDHKLLRNHT
jgi:hypothetical protein